MKESIIDKIKADIEGHLGAKKDLQSRRLEICPKPFDWEAVTDKLPFRTKEEFVDCNILGCEVATNGHQWKNSGHGTFSYLTLSDLASTDWKVRITSNDGVYTIDEFTELNKIELLFEGDSELDNLILALESVAKFLREHKDK